MKTIKIKKSTLFVWLSLCLLAAYTVVVKQNRQEIEIQCSTVARVTLPVSILSIENETLRPEQIDISAYIFPNDSIQIYHLYQGCPCSPKLRLQGDTLQIRPIQPPPTHPPQRAFLYFFRLNCNKSFVYKNLSLNLHAITKKDTRHQRVRNE